MSPSEAQPQKPPSLLEIAVAYMTIGLTSVGGATGPLRHMTVKQKHWLTEGEFAELQGLSQALPGAVVINAGILLTDQFAPLLGPLAAMAGLIIPAMAVAILLLRIANSLSAANTRFSAAEVGVTAALAGIFVSNGIRVIAQLWKDAPDLPLAWRSARIAISALGILLVVGFHMFLPLAMIILVVLSFVFETRLGAFAKDL